MEPRSPTATGTATTLRKCLSRTASQQSKHTSDRADHVDGHEDQQGVSVQSSSAERHFESILQLSRQIESVQAQIAFMKAEYEQKQSRLTGYYDAAPVYGGFNVAMSSRNRSNTVGEGVRGRTSRQVSTTKTLNEPAFSTAVADGMPRFAQATAATTRRNDKTLRLHGTITDKPKPATQKATNGTTTARQASRLPKRNAIPGAWISKDEDSPKTVSSPDRQSDIQSQTPASGVKLKSPPSYLSPTKSTISRESLTQRSPGSDRPLLRSKQMLGKTDTSGQVNESTAAARPAAEKTVPTQCAIVPDHPVENTMVVRRASMSSILEPIYRKLELKGLLRNESAIDTAMADDEQAPKREWRHRKSCTAMLQQSRFRVVKDQSSAQIGQAIAQHVEEKKWLREKRSWAPEPERRVIVPSGSSFAETSEVDLNDKLESGEPVPESHCDPLANEPLVPALMQASASTTSNSRTTSTLNAAAAVFQPSQRWEPFTTPVKTTFASALADEDDVFQSLHAGETWPDDQWYNMPRHVQNEIRSHRLHAQQLVEAQRAQLAQQQEKILQKQLDAKMAPLRERERALEAQFGHILRTSSSTASRSNSWSPGTSRGWRVSASLSTPDASWSGGGGREIRFTGSGVLAERLQAHQYVYNNHATGQTAVLNNRPAYINPTHWYSDEQMRRLQAAVFRGYDKVPCFDMNKEPVACSPFSCLNCEHGF